MRRGNLLGAEPKAPAPWREGGVEAAEKKKCEETLVELVRDRQ